MTASAGAWYRVGTVNVTSGQQAIVGVGTNWQNDVIAIAIGDIFTVDSKAWYEVTAVNSDTSITLDRNFEAATAAGANYAIVRNTSGTILTRIAGQVSVQFNQKQLFLDELRTWLNSDNPSEELTDSHGVKQELKTPAQMVRDHDDKLAELDEIHPFPWAMRKVEFDARRAANNEKYAASGFVYKGKKSTIESQNVADGLYVSSTLGYQKQLYLGREISNLGNSKFDHPVVNIAGVVTNLIMRNGLSRNTYELNAVKFPPTEDGKRTFDSATGVSVTHATPAIAFASETATNKVVTDRVDMWGILQIEQEINDSYPFVYPNGLPQSLAATMNGVATTTNNIQPIEYFAQYAGDTSSRGKGVNWQAATDAQRILLASDPKNKIYFNDATGKFYQTHNFALSFGGMGNGDWLNIDAITGDLAFSAQSKLVPEIAVNATKFTAGTEVGVFTANNNPDCHFLVCGTVNRRNRGFYHDSFNKPGAAKASDDKDWSQTSVSFTSKADCFDTTKLLAGSGSIASGKSGAPDGRFYDAIYASGAGGVCRDMRYSAWGLKAEDFVEQDLAVKSGLYRGRELLKFTRFKISPQQTVAVSEGIVVSDVSSYSVGDYIVLVHPTEGVVFQGTVTRINTAVNGVYLDNSGTYDRKASTYYIAHSAQLKTSVASEFLHSDVIGDPANILQCDDLKDGWVGSWITKIPGSSTNITFNLTKVCKSSPTAPWKYTSNNGANWSSGAVGIDSVRNSFDGGTVNTTGNVSIVTYSTFAKLTKPSVNNIVLGGEKGIGNVIISDSATQAQYLAFSLTDNINTSTSNQSVELSLNQIGIDLETGKLSASKETKHVAIPISAPTDNSSAFKALSYNVVDSQQGYVQYAATELKHNGVDWGDDGKIHIVDNQTTMLDENGNTVLVCTARCVEPLGWIKNDK